jgi:hypothetical protein
MSNIQKQKKSNHLNNEIEVYLLPLVGGVKESMAESYWDRHAAEKWHWWLPKGALVTLQG